MCQALCETVCVYLITFLSSHCDRATILRLILQRTIRLSNAFYLFLFFKKILFIYFSERGKGKEKEREKTSMCERNR